MAAREMPPEEILASWQHIEQRALDLRAAGVAGTLQELRVTAYLDLLQERDSRQTQGDPPGHPEGGDSPGGGSGPDGDSGPGGTGGSGPGPRGRGPTGPGPDGRGRTAARDTGPSIAAQVTITVPLGTALGQSDVPGDVAGFGLVDAGTAGDLLAAAARHRDTRWCLTVLNPDGTAAAHGCAAGRHSWPPGSGPPGTGPPGPPGPQATQFLRTLNIILNPVIRGPCDHSQAEPGYRPSRTLQHLVNARTPRCSAPGCGRPAACCDLDHSTPWDKGGLTCPCNLAPLCRHHHRCKQSQGWKLEQPSPGVLVWRTPAGLTYTTTPGAYPT